MNNCVKLRGLLSVRLSLSAIFGTSLSPLSNSLWHVPWDLLWARLRNAAFQESFSHLWLSNFSFILRASWLHWALQQKELQQKEVSGKVFSHVQGHHLMNVLFLKLKL